MPIVRRLSLLPRLRTISKGCAITVMFVAVLVLVGWGIGLVVLQSIVPGLPTMKPSTAGSFLLCGLSLMAWNRQPDAARMQPVAMGSAALVMLIALVAIAQYVFDWNSGLDRLLFRNVQATDLAPPGRMSLATAAIFLLCSISLLLLAGKRRVIGVAQGVALLALMIALLVLFSYLLRADLTRVGPFSTVAVHTAFAFAVLALGLLVVRADESWFSVFMQDTTSGRNSRRYFLGTLLVLPLFAVLEVFGQRGLQWYDPFFGSALMTVAGISALAAMNWHATNFGNAADRKVANMRRVLATLSGINALIVRVRDKDVLFSDACRIASEVGQFPLVWIATIDAEQQVAQVRAMSGSAVSRLGAHMPRTLQLSPNATGPAGMVRLACASKTPVVLNTIDVEQARDENERLRRQEVSDAGIRSLVTLPLIIDGKVVGAFVLHAERAGFFDSGEMALLEELAGDIAFAINYIDKESVINYLAYYDPLTGLPNRSLFIERLRQQLETSARDSGKVVVLIGNLLRFRMINETYGRHVGDALLRQLATRMRETLDFPENLSRIDGDSFASFMPGASVDTVGSRVQDVFKRVLDVPFRIGDQDLIIDATLAVAVFPADGANAETLMGNLAMALRRAKDTGERYIFYEAAMNARVADAVKLEVKLRRALELGQLELHYQPKVHAIGGRIHSVEALMRWRDPDSGLVPPGQFIPLMEEIGLISQAGAWALRQAVVDMERLRVLGLLVPRCAVNVSAIQLSDPGFVRTVVDELKGFGDNDVKLDIEITESLLMQNVSQTIQVLQTLRGVGVEVAIDDFGTGYSSLAYLVQLPINALKIDRAFVMGMEAGEQSVMIVASIISLAHALKLQVVAEGVETEAQATQLRDMGCDLLQGYLFSKPVPFDQLVALLPRAD